MPKLTKKLIDSTLPPQYDAATKKGKRDFILWDSEVEGFGLRVFSSGRKAYVIQYRADGRTRRLTLGPHGVLTPAQGRKLARERLGEVARGEDPAEVRKQGREAPTVQDLAQRFLTEHIEARRKAQTAREYRRLFDRLILPKLGSHKVDRIGHTDIDRLHRSLKATPYQANRVLALLSSVFNWAERWGWRARHTNPCADVEKFKEKARERYLTGEELTRLGAELQAIEERQGYTPPPVMAIRLLLLTGCRLNEILGLRWDEVDFERGCLRLRDSKTGAKVVPVGSTVLSLIDRCPRFEGNPHVLIGRKDGAHFTGLPKYWGRLRARIGLEDVRIHDLRHNYAAVGASSGLSLPILGKLLGHTQSSTTERYAHLADDPLQRAAGQISEEIAAALLGGGGGEEG